MTRWRLIGLVMSLLVGIGGAHAEGVAAPDTPAGRTLQAWLAAFNSGDRARVGAYVAAIDPALSVDGMIAFHDRTGGFELVSIESSQPQHIRFRVREKNNPTIAFGNLWVGDGAQPKVTTFGLRPLPPGVSPVDVVVDAAMRKSVIDGIDTNLATYYVDAALAKAMQESLDAHARAGDYDSIADGDVLAGRLTKDLRAISHDKHLVVGFSPFKSPPPETPTADEVARTNQRTMRANCGFAKVEILPGDIGYVKFDGFMPADLCGPTAAAAMAFVAHTDALIFDLRDNGGGEPAMVALIASYLFDQPTHLNDLYDRHADTTTQYWTLPYVPGDRLSKQPVYVLTSSFTFSGAEEFCYDLQNQKRATVVGETTGGGAHPLDLHQVADYFVVAVPYAKAINPISKTNWEGTGIHPDVPTAAADALATAEKLALQAVQAARAGN